MKINTKILKLTRNRDYNIMIYKIHRIMHVIKLRIYKILYLKMKCLKQINYFNRFKIII